MFCPKCGAQNPDGAANCMSCGAPLATGAPNMGAKKSFFSLDIKSNLANKMNLFGLIASGVLAISVFLPFVSVFGMGVSFIQAAGGVVTFILSLAAIACSLLSINIGLMVAGGISAILEISNAASVSFNFVTIGFFLGLIAAIAVVVFGVLSFLQSRKK